jgi:hypothetical protein
MFVNNNLFKLDKYGIIIVAGRMSYFKQPNHHPSSIFGAAHQHLAYVAPVNPKCEDIYVRCRRENYMHNMTEWMGRSVYHSYGRDGFVGLDESAEVKGNWRYGRNRPADVGAPGHLDRTANRDVVMFFVNKLQRIVKNHGYHFSNQNQFKDDIIYAIYRLSKP